MYKDVKTGKLVDIDYLKSVYNDIVNQYEFLVNNEEVNFEDWLDMQLIMGKLNIAGYVEV